jgi:predicted Zn finger-like uncharacterized protein
MILTCPECATRYFVDDARIGAEGRKVRCAGCGHAWRQAGAANIQGEATRSFRSSGPDDIEVGPPPAALKSARVRADVSARLREEASEKRRTREAAAVGAVWAVLGAGFCLVMLCAVVFRADVVRLVPGTAGAYAFARMPVNPTGLAIEAVQGGPGLQDGRAALKVSGVVRNVETAPRDAAPLRVSLLDKSNHRLISQVVSPAAGPIQPGEIRPFTSAFLDPPMQAASFQVEFAFDAMKRPKDAASRPPTPAASQSPSNSLKLRGTVPAAAEPAPAADAKEAAPLPPTSPYALPPAAVGIRG